MAGFLKKYGLRIVILAMICALTFVYIPYKGNFYFDEDKENIELLSKQVLIWLEAFLLISLFVYWLTKKIQIDQLVISLFSAILAGGFLFFLFSPLFTSAFYLINDISFNNSSLKQYKVIYVDNSVKSLYLFDKASHKEFHSNSILKNYDGVSVVNNQDVELLFNKGLLGYNKIEALAVKK